MTGANRQALDASGTEYFTVHTHANQHAGYFPGAKPVHILMHVGATDRFSVRKPWVPTAWTGASTSSPPPCGPPERD